MADTNDFKVVIVGAGPVGLALAIEMGSRAIQCLLIERNDRVGYAPRAKTTNVRSRNHMRNWLPLRAVRRPRTLWRIDE